MKMPMWEYKIAGFVSPHLKDVEDTLNEKGKDGWELVAVVSSWMFFKRYRPL